MAIMLSPREQEIMVLIAEGYSVKEVAAKLYLSIQTAYTYRDRIKKKLKLKNNVEIARYAIKKNFIQL